MQKPDFLPEGTPMLDVNDPDFNDKLNFVLNTQGSSSDYANNRDRPYNGQPHTDEGERGKQLVVGLTMRDIKDCFVMSLLESASSDKYLDEDEYFKCWDFTKEPAQPTKYLLERQDHSDYVSTKVETGNWRHQDVYKVDANNIDFLAVCQNLTCRIEKMMGIFPNIPPLIEDKNV